MADYGFIAVGSVAILLGFIFTAAIPGSVDEAGAVTLLMFLAGLFSIIRGICPPSPRALPATNPTAPSKEPARRGGEELGGETDQDDSGDAIHNLDAEGRL